MSRTLYVPLNVDYYNDPKVAKVCDVDPWCEVLWTRCLARAKAAEADGHLTEGDMITLHIPGWRDKVSHLVDAGLLVPNGGGFDVPAWLSHNIPQTEVEAHRARKRANVQAARERGKQIVTAPVTGNNDVVTAPVTGNSPDTTPDTCPVRTPPVSLVEGRRLKDEVLNSSRDNSDSKLAIVPEPDGVATAPRQARGRDAVIDELALLIGVDQDGRLTEKQGKRLGGVARELRKQGFVNGESIREIKRLHSAKWPGLDVTPESIEKHATMLVSSAPKKTQQGAKGWWIDGGPQDRLPSADDLKSGAYTNSIVYAREAGLAV